MLIGIDASRANRPNKTGTEWYSYYLIRWLAKIDEKNQYILYTDKPLIEGLVDLTSAQHEKKMPYSADIDEKGWQKIISPHNNFQARILKWPFAYFWTLARLSMAMIRSKPDVLFIPAHTMPLVYPKKTVITIHDVGFTRENCLYDSEKIGPENVRGKKVINFLIKLFTWGKYGANSYDYLKWSTKFATDNAFKIIAVSEFSKQEIMDIYRTNAGKIAVVYNGYNKSLYKKIYDKEKIASVLKRYGIEPPYLIYTGRLEKKKNTPALIEGFSLFKSKFKDLKYKLVLIGNASYGYDEVNYAIREFGLDKDVIMPGWVEEEDMPAIYSGASAMIFPSKYEGFGIPLLQAMACELPIAASWASSIPEVTDKAALLFNPNSVKCIATAIERILLEEETRLNLIKLGNERIKNFSWEKCAKETLDLINSL